MAENLYLVIIVAGVAGFVILNMRRAKPEPVQVQASAHAAAAAAAAPQAEHAEEAVETGVSRYLRTLPPAPVLTGVAKYLKNLPKPAPETGVARYLKTVTTVPVKPETGVTKYVKSVAATPTSSAAATAPEKPAEQTAAPVRATGVSRYLQAIESR